MSTYTDAVEFNLKGLEAVSTGPCPGCSQCADDYGYETVEAYTTAYEAGKVCSEGSFSWQGCGICGSSLGGDLEPWHALDSDRELCHFSDACFDCVVYLANGDEPEAR